jgi:hypothetical protein
VGSGRQIVPEGNVAYRNGHRHAGIIFDDAYGIWTEADQTSAAAEAFAMFDREEAGHNQSKAR